MFPLDDYLRNMKRYVLSLILLSIASCENATSMKPDKPAVVSTDSTRLTVTAAPVVPKASVDTAGAEIYRYKSDSFQQTLAIKRLSKLSVSFVLTTRLPISGEQEVVSGTANAVASSNAEEDEDEEGMSYPARAYSYHTGKCSLSIHISTDPADQMVHLYEFNCTPMHKPSLPYETGKVLRRQP